MADDLKKHGLFVDESYMLRVLEPQIAKDTQDLKDENEVFLDSKQKNLIGLKRYIFKIFRIRTYF